MPASRPLEPQRAEPFSDRGSTFCPDGGADGARKPRVPAEVPSPTELPAEAVEPPKQDDLDRKAAKVAVEMDSYKRAIFVGKTANGVWRFGAHRGATDVFLIVDETDRGSLE